MRDGIKKVTEIFLKKIRSKLFNHYVIPNWHISSYRVLYWDFFDQPAIKPKYSLGFDTWWFNKNKHDFIQSKRTAN